MSFSKELHGSAAQVVGNPPPAGSGSHQLRLMSTNPHIRWIEFSPDPSSPYCPLNVLPREKTLPNSGGEVPKVFLNYFFLNRELRTDSPLPGQGVCSSQEPMGTSESTKTQNRTQHQALGVKCKSCKLKFKTLGENRSPGEHLLPLSPCSPSKSFRSPKAQQRSKRDCS